MERRGHGGRYCLFAACAPESWAELPERFAKFKRESSRGSVPLTNPTPLREEKCSEYSHNQRDSPTSELKTQRLVWMPVKRMSHQRRNYKFSGLLGALFQTTFFEHLVNSYPGIEGRIRLAVRHTWRKPRGYPDVGY